MNPFQYLNVECSSVDVIKHLILKNLVDLLVLFRLRLNVSWTTVMQIALYVVYDADKYSH